MPIGRLTDADIDAAFAAVTGGAGIGLPSDADIEAAFRMAVEETAAPASGVLRGPAAAPRPVRPSAPIIPPAVARLARRYRGSPAPDTGLTPAPLTPRARKVAELRKKYVYPEGYEPTPISRYPGGVIGVWQKPLPESEIPGEAWKRAIGAEETKGNYGRAAWLETTQKVTAPLFAGLTGLLRLPLELYAKAKLPGGKAIREHVTGPYDFAEAGVPSVLSEPGKALTSPEWYSSTVGDVASWFLGPQQAVKWLGGLVGGARTAPGIVKSLLGSSGPWAALRAAFHGAGRRVIPFAVVSGAMSGLRTAAEPKATVGDVVRSTAAGVAGGALLGLVIEGAGAGFSVLKARRMAAGIPIFTRTPTEVAAAYEQFIKTELEPAGSLEEVIRKFSQPGLRKVKPHLARFAEGLRRWQKQGGTLESLITRMREVGADVADTLAGPRALPVGGHAGTRFFGGLPVPSRAEFVAAARAFGEDVAQAAEQVWPMLEKYGGDVAQAAAAAGVRATPEIVQGLTAALGAKPGTPIDTGGIVKAPLTPAEGAPPTEGAGQAENVAPAPPEAPLEAPGEPTDADIEAAERAAIEAEHAGQLEPAAPSEPAARPVGPEAPPPEQPALPKPLGREPVSKAEALRTWAEKDVAKTGKRQAVRSERAKKAEAVATLKAKKAEAISLEREKKARAVAKQKAQAAERVAAESAKLVAVRNELRTKMSALRRELQAAGKADAEALADARLALTRFMQEHLPLSKHALYSTRIAKAKTAGQLARAERQLRTATIKSVSAKPETIVTLRDLLATRYKGEMRGEALGRTTGLKLRRELMRDIRRVRVRVGGKVQPLPASDKAKLLAALSRVSDNTLLSAARGQLAAVQERAEKRLVVGRAKKILERVKGELRSYPTAYAEPIRAVIASVQASRPSAGTKARIERLLDSFGGDEVMVNLVPPKLKAELARLSQTPLADMPLDDVRALADYLAWMSGRAKAAKAKGAADDLGRLMKRARAAVPEVRSSRPQLSPAKQGRRSGVGAVVGKAGQLTVHVLTRGSATLNKQLVKDAVHFENLSKGVERKGDDAIRAATEALGAKWGTLKATELLQGVVEVERPSGAALRMSRGQYIDLVGTLSDPAGFERIVRYGVVSEWAAVKGSNVPAPTAAPLRLTIPDARHILEHAPAPIKKAVGILKRGLFDNEERFAAMDAYYFKAFGRHLQRAPGRWPIVRELSQVKRPELEAALTDVQTQMADMYSGTRERTGGKAPVRLTGVAYKAQRENRLSAQIASGRTHYLRQTLALLEAPAVRSAITEHWGGQIYQRLLNNTLYQAGVGIFDPASNVATRLVRGGSRGAIDAWLLANISVVGVQATSLPMGLGHMPAKFMAIGMKRFVAKVKKHGWRGLMRVMMDENPMLYDRWDPSRSNAFELLSGGTIGAEGISRHKVVNMWRRARQIVRRGLTHGDFMGLGGIVEGGKAWAEEQGLSPEETVDLVNLIVAQSAPSRSSAFQPGLATLSLKNPLWMPLTLFHNFPSVMLNNLAEPIADWRVASYRKDSAGMRKARDKLLRRFVAVGLAIGGFVLYKRLISKARGTYGDKSLAGDFVESVAGLSYGARPVAQALRSGWSGRWSQQHVLEHPALAAGEEAVRLGVNVMRGLRELYEGGPEGGKKARKVFARAWANVWRVTAYGTGAPVRLHRDVKMVIDVMFNVPGELPRGAKKLLSGTIEPAEAQKIVAAMRARRIDYERAEEMFRASLTGKTAKSYRRALRNFDRNWALAQQ